MANSKTFFVVHALYKGVYCGSANASGICDAIRAAMQLKADGYCYELALYECVGLAALSVGVVCNG